METSFENDDWFDEIMYVPYVGGQSEDRSRSIRWEKLGRTENGIRRIKTVELTLLKRMAQQDYNKEYGSYDPMTYTQIRSFMLKQRSEFSRKRLQQLVNSGILVKLETPHPDPRYEKYYLDELGKQILAKNNNKTTGTLFEKTCHDIAVSAGVVCKWEPTRYENVPDLEFTTMPHYMVDCKHTIHRFTFSDLEKLLKITDKRYCHDENDVRIKGHKAIVIFGQRFGKPRRSNEENGVAFRSKLGLTIVPYKQWLLHLM